MSGERSGEHDGSDPVVEVGLLGPVELRVAGRAVPVPSLPQRVLLARLALRPQRVVPVAELVDSLWDEEPPRGAVGNLHSYVSRLRRLLGGDRIGREPAGYRLRVAAEQVDIGRVDLRVAAARAAAATDPAHGARLLGDALGCWRGDPLADLADRAAFAPERARLTEWRRQLREEWFALRLTAGEAEDVLPDLEEAAAADPFRERVQLLFIRARHLAGRTAEALEAMEAYRRRLAEELGLDPGPELAELQHRLLMHDPGLLGARRGSADDSREPAPRPGPGQRAGTNALRPGTADESGTHAPPPAAAEGLMPNAPPDLHPPTPSSSPALRRPGDRFVGRALELAQVTAALEAHRAVTVVGPGGVGKTRLVTELLGRGGQDEPVHFVELAGTGKPGETAGAVATVLGLRAAPEGDVTAVADRLGGAPALLVLDNCEHLLPTVRELVAELLGRCPALRVLATSRQRLGVPGERVVRLGPPSEEEQVELFCDRAALLRDGFAEGPGAAETGALVAEICRLLDGLPLAVELAAHREAVFGLRQLRERLSAGLDVLEPARGGDRSTAVTATVEWSRRLLDPAARDLLDRLSVCRGGFVAEAVDHLAPPGAGNPAALLAELVDASLVGCDLSAEPPRYRLLETVRHVCATHLPDPDDARAAHARWMAAHAEAVHRLRRDRSPVAAAAFRREAANTYQALSWLFGSGRRKEATRLGLLTVVVLAGDPDLPLVNLLRGIEPAVPQPPHGPAGDDTEAVLAMVVGVAAWMSGDWRTAERLLGAALDMLPDRHPYRWFGQFHHLTNRLFRGDVAGVEADAEALLRHGAPGWVAGSGVCCAALAREFAGDHEAAERWLTRKEVLRTELSLVNEFVTYTRGELAAEHDPSRALACFEEAIRGSDTRGNTYVREIAAIGRAAVLIRLGRHTEAVVACRELVESLRRLGLWPQVWMVLRLTAELLVALGDHATAAALFTASDSDSLAPAVLGTDRDRHAALWRDITDRLGPERLAAHRAEGRRDGRAGAAERALRALRAQEDHTARREQA
ncbi:winged helix-turn-helix domain-containing protein [Streptomyces ferrugineus]|uniref:Winged helix-turn-helix domain-containing protein n=1 Tax=Streptomyces ferrugineus TaxID=1413221 RepID=A0A7M2SF65_9ACTN|nr:BTAD domain-containing putative transcriptional regulator [Streptomyces ferrugineus]QOV34405.1 winged helix-turn-helix domain-containing protein [Streptomyces ferrugineus]